LYFDPTGHYLAAITQKGTYFLDVYESFEFIGFQPSQHEVVQGFWLVSTEKDKVSL
jgi:hypothetical protein